MYHKCTSSEHGINSNKGSIWMAVKPHHIVENSLKIMKKGSPLIVVRDPVWEWELTTVMKIIATILTTLSAVNVLVDFYACMDLQRQPTNYDENGMKTSAICAFVLVLDHMVICIVHFYYAAKLFNIIDEKSFLKFHQWYLKLLPFMGVECFVVFLYLFFPNNVLYFIVFGNMGVTFKLYMLWPVKRFMKHLRETSYIPPGTIWER